LLIICNYFTPKYVLFGIRLFASYLVNSMLTFIFAEFFEFYFGRTFRYTNTCTIVSVAALAAFKPDIFPFTLLFSHKIRPNQAGLITYESFGSHSDSRLDMFGWF
jgi:hypothetical protein